MTVESQQSTARPLRYSGESARDPLITASAPDLIGPAIGLLMSGWIAVWVGTFFRATASTIIVVGLAILVGVACGLLLLPRIAAAVALWKQDATQPICGGCGNGLSRGADRCPKCGAMSERALRRSMKVHNPKPCRSCGVTLDESHHRQVAIGNSAGISTPLTAAATITGGQASASVHGGHSTSMKVFKVSHISCPGCGEPQPLRRMVDIPVVNFLWSFFVALLFMFGFPIGFFVVGSLSKPSFGWSGLILASVSLYLLSKRVYT